MIAPGIFLGDFVEERAVLLARVTDDEAEGAQVRALHILVGEETNLTGSDYWLMQVGRLDQGRFRPVAKEIPLTSLLPANLVRRYELRDPALVSRGTILTLRMSPRGTPPPLAGTSIVVEWGVHASRRASRG